MAAAEESVMVYPWKEDDIFQLLSDNKTPKNWDPDTYPVTSHLLSVLFEGCDKFKTKQDVVMRNALLTLYGESRLTLPPDSFKNIKRKVLRFKSSKKILFCYCVY